MRRLPGSLLILVPAASLLAVFFLVQGAGEPRPGNCPTPDVVRTLLSIGLDGRAIAAVAGPAECPDLRVALASGQYKDLKPLLEKALAEAGISVLDAVDIRGSEPHLRWRLRGPEGTRMDIAFILPAPPPAPPPPGPMAAILVDDMGYSLEAMDALCRLERPVTVSILPFTPFSRDTAARAAACGLETMLHLPLESLGAKEGWRSSVDGTIVSEMSPEDVRLTVASYLDLFPGCRGVNNHTGSHFTEEATLLRPVLDVLKERGLYFIDSRTSRNSVAHEEAVRQGVKTAARHVFLDAENDDAGVRRRLVELFDSAKSRGKAVGIAHPRKTTLEALRLHLGLADEMGVRLVFASAVAD